MLRLYWFAFLTASLALAQSSSDPWAKVKELKSGTELRIYKTGAKSPVAASFDELTDEKLLVATKSEQLAIDRASIEKIDARPGGKSRVTRESTTTRGSGAAPSAASPHARQQESLSGSSPAGGGSSSSSVSIGKPDFETIYRRVGSAR